MKTNQTEHVSAKKEEIVGNETYEFIGRLALALFNQKIKIRYSTLQKILVDNGLDSYGNERGMAQAISAAYRYWDRVEKEKFAISTTPGAIASTFVNKDGYPSWLD